MEEPIVDVVLPAYNGSQVIRKALESALAQSVPTRIIVVDDGSSDDSAAIASTYGPAVTVIRQENRGVSGARNTGIAAGCAPYIALLDQDDVWKPEKLTRQLAIMNAHPEVGLVFTDMLIVREDGEIVEDGFLKVTAPYAALQRQSLGDGAYLLPEALAQAVARSNFISPSTTLLRRTAVQDVGGFDESFRLCDDADCWMRLLNRWRGAVIEDRLVTSLMWKGCASRMWDKLIFERIRLGKKVVDAPNLFAPGLAEYFQKARPISYYRLGIVSLDSGDASAARRYLSRSLRESWRVSTLLVLMATLLPAPIRSMLRQFKRASGIRFSLDVE